MSSKLVGAALISALLFLAAAADEARIVINPKSAYPEGPVAAAGAVYYAEMGADRVMRWDGATNTSVWSRPGCGPTSVARGAGDTLVVLCHREAVVARISRAGETLAIIDRDSNERPFVDPNASVNDGKGGVYFSSSGIFAPGAPAEGAILYLDKDNTLHRLAEGIRYANGVALSPDGRILYVSEHLARRVLAYDVAGDGSLSGTRVFLKLDDVLGKDPARTWEVGPDGLAVDRAGNLVIAEYGGGRLILVDKDGRLKTTISFPEKYVTAPAFIDDEARIIVTAPVSLDNPEAPGKVYSVANPVYGVN